MAEDRTLIGEGPYPPTGPLAVLARLGFLGAVLAIAVAVFLPPWMVPSFVRSNHLEHFAAFYVATLFALAALARTRMRVIAIALFGFATALEGSHLLAGAAFQPLMENWVADLGGVAATFAPVVTERFRRRFRRAPAVR